MRAKARRGSFSLSHATSCGAGRVRVSSDRRSCPEESQFDGRLRQVEGASKQFDVFARFNDGDEIVRKSRHCGRFFGGRLVEDRSGQSFQAATAMRRASAEPLLRFRRQVANRDACHGCLRTPRRSMIACNHSSRSQVHISGRPPSRRIVHLTPSGVRADGTAGAHFPRHSSAAQAGDGHASGPSRPLSPRRPEWSCARLRCRPSRAARGRRPSACFEPGCGVGAHHMGGVDEHATVEDEHGPGHPRAWLQCVVAEFPPARKVLALAHHEVGYSSVDSGLRWRPRSREIDVRREGPVREAPALIAHAVRFGNSSDDWNDDVQETSRHRKTQR